jgi:DNA-binding response OmpR family regulator
MRADYPIDIIVAEADPQLRENSVTGLASRGFAARGVGDAGALNQALARQQPQIVLLDVELPGENGLDIANRLAGNPSLGIVLTSAHAKAEQRTLGLQSGADLYFAKPVHIAELAAALRNLARRLARPLPPSWDFSARASCLRTPNSHRIALTAQECSLLDLLFARPGRNVTRGEILTALDQSEDSTSNARIEVLVSRLRSKVLRTDPESPLPLRARNSKGYVLLTEEGHAHR